MERNIPCHLLVIPELVLQKKLVIIEYKAKVLSTTPDAELNRVFVARYIEWQPYTGVE